MKTLVFALMFVGFSAIAQEKGKTMVVEASCGQCQFGLTGGGCDLAVKIDDKAYYVDGSSMDEHGDAHSHDGMCNAVRKAEVSGEVVEGRYKATSFKLLPAPEAK